MKNLNYRQTSDLPVLKVQAGGYMLVALFC